MNTDANLNYLGFCVCGPHCQSAGTVAAAHVRLYSAGDSIGGVPTGAGAVAEPTDDAVPLSCMASQVLALARKDYSCVAPCMCVARVFVMPATKHWRRGQTRSGLAGVVQFRAVEPAARRQQRRRRQGASEQHLAEADEAHAVQVEVDLTDSATQQNSEQVLFSSNVAFT